MIGRLGHKRTDEGVLIYFDTQVECDAFMRTVEALQEPIRDPDSDTATARLLEIREWCDKHDPWGATAAGFVVRLMRRAIDRRIYATGKLASECEGKAAAAVLVSDLGFPAGDAGDLP